MSPDAIVAKIKAVLPDATVELEDLTGTADHWRAVVTSSAFEGCSLIERHRVIMSALADEMTSGAIHALSLDAKTPPPR